MHRSILVCLILGIFGSSALASSPGQELLSEAQELAGADPRKAFEVIQKIESTIPVTDSRLHLEKDLLKCELLVDNNDPTDALKITRKYAGAESLNADLRLKIELCHYAALETMGESKTALEGLMNVLEASQLEKLPEVEAKALLSLGQLLSYQNQFSQSLKSLLTARDLFVAQKNTNMERITLNSIAVLYGRMGENKKALEYFEEVLERNRSLNKQRNIAVVLSNMGRRYEDLGDYKSALSHLQESLHIHRTLGNVKSQAVVERALGSLYNNMNQPAKALGHLQSAIHTLQDMNLPKSLAQSYLELGRAHLKLSNNKLALENLKKAASFNQEPSSVQLAMEIREEEARLFEGTGMWKEAYLSLLDFKKQSDRLHKIKADEQLRQLNFKFDLSKKEEDNRMLKAKNEAQLVILVLTSLLLGLTALFTIRQIRTARRMRELALTDELTRIPNRRHILDFAEQSLSNCRRQKNSLAVIIFDIDHFKKINDTYGHAIGDEVIKRVAKLGSKSLRRGDMIGRVGGEEFLAVLPFTNPAAGQDVAERIRMEILNCDMSDLAPGLRVTVSAGVACISGTDWNGNIDGLIHQADEALYHVKKNGRNAVSLSIAS